MVRLASVIGTIHATRKGPWVAMRMDANCKRFIPILNATARNTGMDTAVNGTTALVKMGETVSNVTQRHVAKIPFVHVPKDGKAVSAKVTFLIIFLFTNLFFCFQWRSIQNRRHRLDSGRNGTLTVVRAMAEKRAFGSGGVRTDPPSKIPNVVTENSTFANDRKKRLKLRRKFVK